MKTFQFNCHLDADDKGFMAEYDFPLNSNIQSTHTFSEDVAWPAVLGPFLDFLGSVYGYNIKSQVKYDGNEWAEEDNEG